MRQMPVQHRPGAEAAHTVRGGKISAAQLRRKIFLFAFLKSNFCVLGNF
jgi:hypothetical protein